MARKKNTAITESHRERIQVSMLLNLLADHAKGVTELSQTRLKAIEILLKKSMPDLSSVDTKVTGENVVRYYAELPRKDATAEEWSQRVGPTGTGKPAQAVDVNPDETKH